MWVSLTLFCDTPGAVRVTQKVVAHAGSCNCTHMCAVTQPRRPPNLMLLLSEATTLQHFNTLNTHRSSSLCEV